MDEDKRALRVAGQRLRRETFEQDPLGYAVIQSVEDGGRTVHVPFGSDWLGRLRNIADNAEVIPERRDPGVLAGEHKGRGKGDLLSMASLVFRGKWVDGVRDWCIRIDDVPESEAH